MSYFSALVRDQFQGQKVKYIHLRNYDFINQIPHNMGGATLAFLEEDGLVSRFAVSYCSEKDNFSRQTGRIISRERLNFSKDIPVSDRVDTKEFIEQVEAEWFGVYQENKYLKNGV